MVSVLFANQQTLLKRWCAGLAVFVFSLVLTFAQSVWAAPAANTTIDNQAQARLVDSATGLPVVLDSNRVSTQVGQIATFLLTSAQNKVSGAGSLVSFQHTITNLGNGNDSYALSLDDSYSGTFNFTSVALFADANSDGVPDSLTPITSTPILAPGQSYFFIVSARVPNTAGNAQEDRFTVMAKSSVPLLAPQSNVDIVNVTNDAVIAVTKSFSETSGPSPFSPITVTLSYTNIGNAAATNLILEDVIGAANASLSYDTSGLSYIPNGAIWQTLSVTDAPGGDAVGISFQAITLGSITTIQAVIANLAPGASGTLSFKVAVKPGLSLGSASTTNAASLQYFDGRANQTGRTNNTAFYSVVPSGPDLMVSKSLLSPLTAGAKSTYSILVRNIGTGISSLPITVTDQIPIGLAVDAATLPGGSGGTAGSAVSSWSCSAVGQTVSCTSSALVAAGQDHAQPILIKVTPEIRLVGQTLTNTAVVSGGGENAAYGSNNSGSTANLVSLGASVTGRVWYDSNHNRRFDTTELSAPGISVELRDANNQLIATALTDSQGVYLFQNIAPKAGYRIYFRASDGSRPMLGYPVNGEAGIPNPSSSGVVSPFGFIDGITLVPGANVVEQNLPLDPSGVVYDSQTRQPVKDAVVSIKGPAGFDAAIHLVGGLPNVEQITGASGQYQFLLQPGAPVGVYTLIVVVPAGYQPQNSKIIPVAKSLGCASANCLDPLGLAPPGGVYSVQAANISTAPPVGQDTTYYLNFYLDTATNPNVVNNHIPLDPFNAIAPGLFVEKIAAKTIAELGEVVPYILKIRNSGSAPFNSVGLVDQLPFGFKYIAGTARLDGATIADPLIYEGSRLTFKELANLAPSATASLNYLVRLVPGAQRGDGINRAQAFSANSTSNIATAYVKYNPGIFNYRGIVVGKVFVDCNQNARQDPEELGIPNVRLYLQDGTYAITDSEGKYSFVGLAPTTHVVKIDRTSLPAMARMVPTNQRSGGVGDSRFIDMKNGELLNADFAEGGCSPTLLEAVKVRRKKGEVFGLEAEKSLLIRLDPEGKPLVPADARALPASGLQGSALQGSLLSTLPLTTLPPTSSSQTSGFGTSLGGENGGRSGSGGASTWGAASPSVLGPNGFSATSPVNAALAVTSSEVLHEMLENIDNKLGFVDLKDLDTLPVAQTHVRIKAVLGAKVVLKVNDVEIAQTRVGTRSEMLDRQLLFMEYVGIALRPGKNKLELVQQDDFGNQRGQESITLIAPDKLGRIELSTNSSVIADGKTPVKIIVKVTDDQGVPVTVRTPVTVEVSTGRLLTRDLDKTEPGTQAFIVGGTGEFEYIPPLEPGDVFVRVSSGVLKAEARLPALPDLRPLIGVGIIEGVINARGLKSSQLVPARTRDGFEAELRRFARANSDGTFQAAARAAFYLKGKIKGDHLLTLAFDSEKQSRERLFRDIQPNEFYPVYGDSAIRGFDAQSTSRLYVRVDKNKSYLLWGDFTTVSPNPAQRLAQYQRSLTGVRHHFETDSTRIDTFASRDTTRQSIRELPTNGTSGPFDFGISNGLVNSEKVELLIRDRFQPALILKATPLIRFADYEYEPLTGRLLLRAAMPSVDPQLNPMSLRMTTEIDQGGQPFWVYGVSGQTKISESLTLGANAVRNNNPIADSFSTMVGVNLQAKLGKETALIAELARTDQAVGTASHGNAGRIEVIHQSEFMRVRAHVGRADIGFNNPGSILTKGREEAGARVDYKLTPMSTLVAEVLQSKDLNTGAKREGVLISLDQAVTDKVKVEVGMRHLTEQTPANGTLAATNNDVTSARIKVSAQIPNLPAATAYGELEQDINHSDKKVAAIGGTYQFASRGKLYARHEFVSTLLSSFALNNTQRQNLSVLGVSTDYMNNGTLFSEYRTRDAIGQKTAEAAIGLRNAFTLAEGVRLNTTAEKINSLSGSKANESIALGVGLDYTASERWKGSTRLEYRDATSTQSWLQTAGLAAKLSRDWTALAKHTYSNILTKGGGVAPDSDRVLQRVQLGLAFRETDQNRINSLFLVEHKREADSAAAAITSHRSVSILSTHLNYQPTNNWMMTGRYSTKWARETLAGSNEVNSNVDWISGRLTYDVTKNWDVGLQASLLRDRRTGVAQRGVGAEIGYMVKNDVWLSLGYNALGYRDQDLTSGQYTDKGFYLRIRFKFDEDLFARPSKQSDR